MEGLNTTISVEMRKFATAKALIVMEKKHITQIIVHNRVLLTGTILMLAVVAAIIVGLCLPSHEPTLQGQLETTDYRVATKVPSRVVRLCAAEGDRVRRGDTLAILTAPEVDARERAAQAASEAAEAGKRLVDEGTRKEVVATARERWRQAVAQLTIREKTWKRMESLYQQGVVSGQRRDEARAAYDAARAAANAANQQYQMAVNGARSEERTAASAKARGAREQVAQVKAYVDETVLTAPQDGVVTEVFVEPGEIVGSGAPVMNVETDDAWFTFYFTEDHLQGIDYGSHVRVYRPASGDTIEARVTRINNAGNFAAWKSTRALEDLDLKVFDVRVRPLHKMKSPHGGESAVLLK